MTKSRWYGSYWFWVAALVAIWTIAAWAVVPGIIRRAYSGDALPIFNAIITGQARNPVEVYLDAWARVRLLGTGALVLGAVVVYLGWRPALAAAARLWRDSGDVWTRLRSRDVLLIALGAGVLAGLGEATIVGVRKTWFGFPAMDQSRDMYWMIPLATGVLYTVFGLVLTAVGRWLPRLLTVPVVLFVAGAAVVDNWLEVGISGLHWFAALILALGIATRVPTQATGAAALRRIRRTVFALVLLVPLIAIGQTAWRTVSERRARASLGDARPGSPNVLLLILDTVRAQSLSLYGYGRPTSPRLDSIAREGLTFEMALAPTSWTLPSHASLFTGQPTDRLSTVSARSPLDDSYPTLAEVLGKNGYQTGGFAANLFFLTDHFGLDRGFDHWEDYPISTNQFLKGAWPTRELVRRVRSRLRVRGDWPRKRADVVNRQVVDWIADRDPDHPYFAFVNYYDAHLPYLPPEPFRDVVAPGTSGYHAALRDGVDTSLSPEVLGALHGAYDNAIGYLDHYLGELLNQLEASGALDNTIVVIASDHGEMFGEQGPAFWEHGKTLSMSLLHVPLVMIWEGHLPAGWVEGPVPLRGVAGSVLDLAEIRDPAFDSLPRLAPLSPGRAPVSPIFGDLTPGELVEPEHPSFYGYMQSVVIDSLHYLLWGDGREQLFDIYRDPFEVEPLRTDSLLVAPFRDYLETTRGP